MCINLSCDSLRCNYSIGAEGAIAIANGLTTNTSMLTLEYVTDPRIYLYIHVYYT